MIADPRTREGQWQQRRMKARQQRAETEDVREIGPPPDIVDPEQRERCKGSLRDYLLTYNAPKYSLAFSADHEELIELTQKAVFDGGNVVAALPRGSGKTTIFQDAIVWAILYGHRKFGMLVCADDKKFSNLLEGIKTAFEANALLYQDFPEVCHPIVSLDRSATRALYQVCEGVPTYIKWGAKQIVLPTTRWTIERGNAASCISGGGLSGAAIRGPVYVRPDGSSVRPDLVLADDPQTRKSARSESQCQEREDILKADVMGMAGPDGNVALCVACTVIQTDDLAERLLDRERSPEFHAVRVSMIKSWPANMDRWEEYHEIRRQELLGEREVGSAAAFYGEHRDAMDDGCRVYWEERVKPGFSSAIESAMANYLQDPRSFLTEYQNAPDETIDTNFVPLQSLVLVQRQGPEPRGWVPGSVETITAHIDVQQTLLYWMVVGWTESFGGFILDYGHTPPQNRKHFNLLAVRKTLQKVYPDDDIEGSIRQGVAETVTELTNRRFLRRDGAEMAISRGLVDVRYKPTVVEDALDLAEGGAVFMPAWGVGIGAKDTPLKLRTAFRGKTGLHWVRQRPADRRMIGLFIDTNFWKSEIYNGLSVPRTHSHAIQFFKTRSASIHQMPADHFCAERATRVEAAGRKIDEWDNWRRADNHHFDNLVGCAVAASHEGVRKASYAQPTAPVRRRKRRVKY